MRTRILSSFIVVAVGLSATLIGGPIYVLVMIALGVAGYREFLGLAARVAPLEPGAYLSIGYGIVAALGVGALTDAPEVTLLAVTVFSVAAPLVLLFRSSLNPEAIFSWSIACAGSLYVGLPVYAAIAMRSMPGSVNSAWLMDGTRSLSIGSQAAPLGLAWTLTVVLATWIGDSTAYLVGRAIGTHTIAPKISPNKTVEGALGGLAGSIGVGAMAFSVFGLGTWWLGAVAGAAIGLAGQLGDLGESFLKRQAHVKDSGAFIPGHGGVLDRIDALLFAFPAGFMLASGYEWLSI